MDYLSFFLSVTVSHLSMYFYHNDPKKIKLALRKENEISDNKSNFFDSTSHNKNEVLINNFNNHFTDNRIALNRNLKHLEFINYLESHIHSEAPEKMSVDFLNEFNTIKQTVQMKTIEVSKKLS